MSKVQSNALFSNTGDTFSVEFLSMLDIMYKISAKLLQNYSILPVFWQNDSQQTTTVVF